MTSGEILMEQRLIGGILRVTAVDVDTGTEVVFQAPAATPRLTLHRLAANKLRYVINKHATRV